MKFEDLFKPYSPEIRGNLEEYLREHDGISTGNLFHGPEYFFIIRDKKLMVSGSTCIRVNRSPIPDVGYFINSVYLLESSGCGEYNMSMINAEKGVYDPNEVLKDQNWSILHLNFLLLQDST